MIGIRQKLRYTEILAARNILKDMIKETTDKEEKILLNDIKNDLDKIFLNQISFIEHEADINHPAK
jgi:hypothetical protein